MYTQYSKYPNNSKYKVTDSSVQLALAAALACGFKQRTTQQPTTQPTTKQPTTK